MDLTQCFLSLSRGLDFSYRGMMQHHHRVALTSVKLGIAAGLTGSDLFELFQAAIIHDIGAISWREKAALEKFDVVDAWEHCRRGYKLVSGCTLLKPLAAIILSHHDAWTGGNLSGLKKSSILLASRIIHLADRVDVLIDDRQNILDQGTLITNRIRRLAGQVFDPDLSDLLCEIARPESFWLDMVSTWGSDLLVDLVSPNQVQAEEGFITDIAHLFAQLVDAKSPFTYRHSNGVKAVAGLLAKQAGWPGQRRALLEVAGLLHDLGKLAVPAEILEKPGSLTEGEFNTVKSHAYYTYWLLRPVTTDFPLAEWAAYHHEKLDGRGYPFGKISTELDTGARIITVADMFTALREERPYRPGLPWREIRSIINEHASKGVIDPYLSQMLLDNQNELDQIWAGLSVRPDPL